MQEGLVAWLGRRGVAYLPHSPLGGYRRHKGGETTAAAAQPAEQRHLFWLLSMAPNVLPLPGATRRASARSSAAAATLEDRGPDASFSWAPGRREEAGDTFSAPSGPEEAVLFIGSPAAGKTDRVDPLVRRGHVRLNRDLRGGRLDDLVPEMEQALERGERRFVLDNTYPTRRSRRPVLELAQRFDLDVRCVYVDTPLEEALYNAASRMLARQGALLGPEEIKVAGRQDPNILPPQALYRYRAAFEHPAEDEGFASVEVVPFSRRRDPAHTHRALVLDYDGTLRRSRDGAPFPRDPDDVELLPGRREVLQRYAREGWLLLGVSNQGGVAAGMVDRDAVEACFARTNELLGVEIDVRYCPHPAGAVACFCRKPMPGLGVQLIQDHGLDRGRCLFVGDMDSDEAFARNVGFAFQRADPFFAMEGSRG